MRFPALLLLSSLLAAADLGVWQAGPGTVAGAAATPGTLIPDGIEAASGAKAARLTLVVAPQTTLTLAPSTRIALEEHDGSLRVRLIEGIVQADVKDKGPYATIHVAGAVFDVAVTGTLFLVERVKADTDYIALLEGRVKVSLREEVARALGREVAPVELNGRQGLEASSAGFGAVATLTSRPSLPTGGELRSVRAQAAEGTGASWTSDPAPTPVVDTPAVAPTPVIETPVVSTEAITATVTEQVRQAVVGDVSGNVTQTVQQQVQEAVVQTIVAPTVLGRPPGPPAE